MGLFQEKNRAESKTYFCVGAQERSQTYATDQSLLEGEGRNWFIVASDGCRVLPSHTDAENGDAMNELDSPLSSTAERMRLHRERRRNGMRSLWIELHVTEIDALVRIGLLKAETRNDPNAICEALYKYFDRTLGRAA